MTGPRSVPRRSAPGKGALGSDARKSAFPGSRMGRFIAIGWTVLRYRLDEVALAVAPESRLVRLLRLVLVARPTTSPAERLRRALTHLGPVFVKFGQILSTRRDLLPAAYADELARLQDRVPPFDTALAIARVERRGGKPIDELFASFDQTPLASASLAQVHAATLQSGDDVVVKIIRPSVERVIANDLALLYAIAGFLERVSHDARRLHLETLVADYERTIFDELNLLLEAANTTTLRRNFAGSDLLYVPRVYWDHSSEDVLVLERIRGVPIADVQRLRECGTDMRKLAERGVETFFTQVFEHNFFHADMHPGNIFVDVTDPAEPSYIAVDCAIIGQLTEADQTYLAKNLAAFFNQDYARVARLHAESGWIPPGTDVGEFETVIRQLCEPIFERPLKDISFGHFLVALFRTARRFDMEVQPQLVLLQKTLLNIEGLGRQLYPDLDLWHTAKPFMERWMEERYGPLALARRLVDQAPALIDALPNLPEFLLTATAKLNDLDRLGTEQRTALAEVTRALSERRRGARWRQAVGAMLAVAGCGLLWPFAEGATGGDAGVTALLGGVLALFGAFLVGRG